MRRVFTDDLEVINKQLRNADEEDYLLRRYPFHEAKTRRQLFSQYMSALELMYQDVPDQKKWPAIQNRLSRKLTKRYKEIINGKI